MSTDLAPTYFISDLHLEASRPAISEAFRHFLFETAQDAKAIYILGDLVDAWIGDDNNSTFSLQIQSWLKQRSDQGTAIFFIHGNRDFLIGEDFAKNTGVTLLPESHVIDMYGSPLLVLHGDQLCSDDVDYQAFRRKVRQPEWQAKMLAYPLWVRKLLAAYMRRKSRKAHKNKSDEIMDVSAKTVGSYFTEFGVINMVHGHTHRPARHRETHNGSECARIVLGDWGKTGWYYRVDADTDELIEFPIN